MFTRNKIHSYQMPYSWVYMFSGTFYHHHSNQHSK